MISVWLCVAPVDRNRLERSKALLNLYVGWGGQQFVSYPVFDSRLLFKEAGFCNIGVCCLQLCFSKQLDCLDPFS